jgi:hypothetical protein
LVDFHEIWQGGDAIQGNLGAIIFNPIASANLKRLRLKFQTVSLAQQFTKGSEIILSSIRRVK